MLEELNLFTNKWENCHCGGQRDAARRRWIKGSDEKYGGEERNWWGPLADQFYLQKVNFLHPKIYYRGTVETQAGLGESDIVRTNYNADASEIGGHSRCA